MRWKSVALAGAAWPALSGCTIVENASRNIINEPKLVHAQREIRNDLKKEAKGAWREVRADYPRRAFTEEFHDGFMDGYVDYLDRGGNGSVPAVPPSRYVRNKKYFTEEGHCLMQDYFLGFRYGQEIAIATGKRKFFTVPVLLPQEPPQPTPFNVIPGSSNTLPPPMPVPVPPAMGAISARPAPMPATTAELQTPPTREKPLPRTVARPAVPVPLPANIATDVSPPAGGATPAREMPTAPFPRLPAPPREVPELPTHVPTPSLDDELPVVPPLHTAPPVIPPIHPGQSEE
ncbi:MAG TPA: hypothetical protein VLM40_21665 [Gemmata sp.]|nr:hypothetical protein [Gemmata sp.]